MSARADMAGRAYKEALRLRARTNRQRNTPVCPFDLAEEIGVEVWFADIPSLEAMYVDDGLPKIILASDRPSGRQRFSCAHELGHHIFGHGTHLTCMDLSQARTAALSDEEFIAQAFAGFLMLPSAAVSHAFAVRGWNASKGVPEEYFVVASALGVSYEALITQCEVALRLLPRGAATLLRKTKPADLRAQFAGTAIAGHLVVADAHALGTALDVRVDDHLLAPSGTRVCNDALVEVANAPRGRLLRAARPGISGMQQAGESNVGVVRISRAAYVGRAIFRHLADPDHD